MEWIPFDESKTMGTVGSEGDTIERDDEHPLGARITLESDSSIAPFAITCGIYGWMFHTRYINSREEAEDNFQQMESGLSEILEMIPTTTDPDGDAKMAQASDALERFVERFP